MVRSFKFYLELRKLLAAAAITLIGDAKGAYSDANGWASQKGLFRRCFFLFGTF